MDELLRRPDLRALLDPVAEDAEAERREDGTLLVTTRGDDGGQLLLREVDGSFELVAADNVIDFSPEFAAAPACAGECTAQQYATVAEAMVAAVDNFSSATGPDNGNLACLWAVRHLVRDSLGFWITRHDGTARFYPQLVNCFGGDRPESDIPPGGIVISPTSGSRVGHIGLLGTGQGDDRLIYSNSSRAAMWKQNYTIRTWRERYDGVKNLPVYFFPLPRF